MQMLKKPSVQLMDALDNARKTFVNTAGVILSVYEMARMEGYDKMQARKLIEQHVGLTDRQIRSYLPADAKEMKHDGSKQQKENKGEIIKPDKTLEEALAEIQRLKDQIAKITGGHYLTLSGKWAEEIKANIQNAKNFKIMFSEGKIAGVVSLD